MKILIAFMTIFTTFLISCEKDDTGPEAARMILGKWEERYPSLSNATYEFDADGNMVRRYRDENPDTLFYRVPCEDSIFISYFVRGEERKDTYELSFTSKDTLLIYGKLFYVAGIPITQLIRIKQ